MPLTTLTIPDVAEDVAQRLQSRAAVHGRSLEAEARAILADAVAVAPTIVVGNIAAAIAAIMAPLGGVDLATFPDQPAQDPPAFS